ncbi:MAG: site-2 protease family protein [Armatimonadota bacterium]
MTKELRIGRIFGIEIAIDYTWFIIFFIVAAGLSTGWLARYMPGVPLGLRWIVAGLAAILFFASVLLHELSHSIIALRNGMKVSGITLFLFGGVSKLSDEPKSAGVELKMAIAGPLTSVALALVFLALAFLLKPVPVLSGVFRWLGIVNGFLAAFNLVPGFPLDGGRVLRAGIWQWTANLGEATRIAAGFGQGVGILMIVGGILSYFLGGGFGGLWLAFIGWFLMQAAQSSYQQMMLRQALTGVSVTHVMTPSVDSVPPDLTLDQVVHDYIMARNHPAFPVVEDGRLLGLLCVTEVRAIPRQQWPVTTARQAAAPLSDHNTISPSADAWEALVRMSQENCGRLLVVENGMVRGIISRTDIMRLMRSRLQLGL